MIYLFILSIQFNLLLYILLSICCLRFNFLDGWIFTLFLYTVVIILYSLDRYIIIGVYGRKGKTCDTMINILWEIIEMAKCKNRNGNKQKLEWNKYAYNWMLHANVLDICCKTMIFLKNPLHTIKKCVNQTFDW